MSHLEIQVFYFPVFSLSPGSKMDNSGIKYITYMENGEKMGFPSSKIDFFPERSEGKNQF